MPPFWTEEVNTHQTSTNKKADDHRELKQEPEQRWSEHHLRYKHAHIPQVDYANAYIYRSDEPKRIVHSRKTIRKTNGKKK